jgi:hypothetical protein
MDQVRVVGRHGQYVDFKQAMELMDIDLLNEAIAGAHRRFALSPDQIAQYEEYIFRWYCASHFDRYGKQFICDDDPYWGGSWPLAALSPEMREIWERNGGAIEDPDIEFWTGEVCTDYPDPAPLRSVHQCCWPPFVIHVTPRSR